MVAVITVGRGIEDVRRREGSWAAWEFPELWVRAEMPVRLGTIRLTWRLADWQGVCLPAVTYRINRRKGRWQSYFSSPAQVQEIASVI